MSYRDDLDLESGTRQWLEGVSERLGQGWAATLALELHEGHLIDLGPYDPALAATRGLLSLRQR